MHFFHKMQIKRNMHIAFSVNIILRCMRWLLFQQTVTIICNFLDFLWMNSLIIPRNHSQLHTISEIADVLCL